MRFIGNLAATLKTTSFNRARQFFGEEIHLAIQQQRFADQSGLTSRLP
jgi:hypothetical protein